MSAWYQDFSNNLFRAIYKSHFYQTKWNPSRSILLFLIKDIMLDATLNFHPKSIVFLLGGGGVKRCFGMVLVHKTFCLKSRVFSMNDCFCFYWAIDLRVWPHLCTPEIHYWRKITHQLYSGKLAMLDYLQLKVTEIFPTVLFIG